MSELIAEPGAAPAAPEPVEAPAEPAWTPSQEEWQQTQAELAALRQQVAPPQQQQEPQGPDFDPFDPESVAAYFGQLLEERLAPIQSWQQQMVGSEAEERALDIMESFVARDGEMLNQEAAFTNIRANADFYYAEEAQKHGAGPKAAEAAIERAYKAEREYQEQVGKAYYERVTNQLRTLDGAPSEPGTRYAQGAVEHVTGDYTKGGSVADRFFGG